MGIFDMLLGSKPANGGSSNAKMDEILERLERLEGGQKDAAQRLIQEIREVRVNGNLTGEQIIKRVESVQEKLQYAIEEYVATDEDVKEMVRGCLKSETKTFNEIQKETKVAPATLAKYLRMMKNEIEEYNGAYRIAYHSSVVILGSGKGLTNEDGRSLEDLVIADALYEGEKKEA